MKKITIVNKNTGEVFEYSPNNLSELMVTYRDISETIRSLEEAKKQLAAQVETNERGVSDEIDGYMFRRINVQRMTYDKALLRQYLDEDALDIVLIPDKKAVDAYLSENLELLGDAGTVLRKGMIASGNPYSVTKLEKTVR